MTIQFKKAIKTEAKLRLALAGLAGSGKTYTALTLATLLAEGKPIAVIDTERGSASKYADLFAFDTVNLDNFHPDHYIEAINTAVSGGYAVIVIDSLSHAWNGVGGLLELHEQVVKRQKTPNSYTAWADITPIQNRLINAITGANIHVIATMRSKQDYVQTKNERGSTEIRKAGMGAIQRDGMEYEFDVFGEMDMDHHLLVQKSRCPAMEGQNFHKPGQQVADILREWLSGAPKEVVAQVVPEMTPAQRTAPPQTAQERPTLPRPTPMPVRAASGTVSTGADALATERQTTSIKKLCAILKRDEPDFNTLTFAAARDLLTQLSAAYSEARVTA